MEPLKTTDARQQAKLDRALADLEKFYPDRVVESLEKQHKGLANRLGELAKDLGYASRTELMEAHGFTMKRRPVSAKGGRPVTFDHEALLAELHRRYEGKEVPRGVAEFSQENPDLAAAIKTFANKARQLCGDTCRNVLIKEGLLKGEVSERQRSSVTREQMDAALEGLAEVYKDEPDKPRTVKALVKRHPEYAEELSALQNCCKGWYGTTPTKHLKSLGVLQTGVADVDDDAVEEALARLQELYGARANDEKPRTVKELIGSHPDMDAVLQAAQRKYNARTGSFVDVLRERGILAQPAAVLKRKAKEAIGRCARNASVSELVAVWRAAGGTELVLAQGEAGGGNAVLPARVVGLDCAGNLEVRESVLCGIADPAIELAVGDEVRVDRLLDSLTLRTEDGKRVFSCAFSGAKDWVETSGGSSASEAAASPLHEFVGARVAAVSDAPNGSRFVQVCLRYLIRLTVQTMLATLVLNGVLTEDDLFGGDEWRSRDYSTLGMQALCADSAEPLDPDREGMIAVLQMAALSAALGSGGLPEELVEELTRAADGDKTVDVDDLARRINEFLPSVHTVDPTEWTYDQGLRASTSQFSIAIPDGYRVIKDYTEQGIVEFERPFVALPGDVPDSDIPNCDRIIAAQAPDVSDREQLLQGGIDELFVALQRRAAYGSDGGFSPSTIDDQVVKAANGTCLLAVVPAAASEGFEYYLKPCALGVSDWLRITFYNGSIENEPRYRPVIERLASTLEIKDRKSCQLQHDFDRCQAEYVDAEFFVTTVTRLANVLGLCREYENEANLSKAQKGSPSFSTADAVATVVEGMSTLGESQFAYCEQAFGALKRQAELGASAEDLRRMLDTVREFHDSFEMNVNADGDREVEQALEASGGIRLPSRFKVVATDIEAFASLYLTEGERRPEQGLSAVESDTAAIDAQTDTVGAAPDDGPQSETGKPANASWRGSNLLTTAVEAALEELKQSRAGEYVGSDFVSQSEKIIGSILSQQQVEADLIARKRYESGEDIKLLLSLHKELGYVLCHVLDAYLDCIEGKCKAGCDSDSLKTMLAEVQEVVDLIKQDPSITDSKLGKVRIGKARIPAEFKKLDARRKELKKKVDELKRQEVASRKEERRKQKVEKLEKRLTRERRSLEKIHYGFQEQELAGLEIKAKVAGSRIADLQKERDSLGLLKFAKKRELSDKIEAQQRDLEKLEAKIAPLRAEVEESRQRESRLRTSIADLERELAEFRGDDGE